MDKDTDNFKLLPDPLLLPAPAAPPVPSPQRMPTLPQLAIALGALLLIFAFSYLPIVIDRNRKPTRQTVEKPLEAKPVTDKESFKDVNITASAAYVWDVKNQRALYNKNAGMQLPLASLTKLMTALVAYEHLTKEANIPITEEALQQSGNSGFSKGETFTLRNLANLTLITSSNDGAYALAASAGGVLVSRKNSSDENAARTFIAAMNVKAEEIGLSQSYFANPTGLDIDGTTSGSYGSARDMAFLMEYLVLKHPEILEGTKNAVSHIYDREGARFRAVNTNEITGQIPGLIASKTGFTGLAGGNLVVAYDAGLNRPIIISVLDSTREGRFSDVATLIKETDRAIMTE